MSDQTPEADAIPTPPAAPAPADVIDAVMAFVAKHASGPIEQLAVSYAQSIVNSYKTQLAGVLGMSGPLTVRGVVDQVFAFVESKAQRPFVRYALKGLNLIVDDVGLPILQAYLLSLGIPIPLA